MISVAIDGPSGAGKSTLARRLAADGTVPRIELCGAFGPEGARAVRQAAGESVAVGYVVHDPSQDPVFEAFWGK